MRLTLAKAKKIVSSIPKELKLTSVGSVLQGKKHPQDIDFITTTSLDRVYDYFNNNFKVDVVPIRWEKFPEGSYIEALDIQKHL
jgi:hypothetical protein